MVGAELGLSELQRLLIERQGQVQLPGSPIGTRRGCSWLRACRDGRGRAWFSQSFSVSSNSGRARSSFPAASYAKARLFMHRERVGMVGAELGLLKLERLLPERQGQVQLSGSTGTPSQVVHG